MEEPLVSIIVPVYNAEPYLEQCLNSISAQTYRNLEIILVDDGSADRSGEICDGYAERDGRFRVIRKENGGPADARSAGLCAAEGSYIGFVDSDDYIAPEMFEMLAAACVNNRARMSCCGFCLTDGSRILETWPCGKDRTADPETVLGDMLTGKCNTPVLWNKLFSADLFDGISFPKGEVHEDFAVLHLLTGKAGRIAYTDHIGYYYRKHGSEAAVSSYSTAMMEQQFKDIELWRQYLTGKYPSLLPVLEDYTAEQYLRMASLYLQSGQDTRTDEYRRLKKGLSQNMGRILRHKGLRANKKAKAVLIRIGLYSPVRKLYRRAKGQRE